MFRIELGWFKEAIPSVRHKTSYMLLSYCLEFNGEMEPKRHQGIAPKKHAKFVFFTFCFAIPLRPLAWQLMEKPTIERTKDRNQLLVFHGGLMKENILCFTALCKRHFPGHFITRQNSFHSANAVCLLPVAMLTLVAILPLCTDTKAKDLKTAFFIKEYQFYISISISSLLNSCKSTDKSAWAKVVMIPLITFQH